MLKVTICIMKVYVYFLAILCITRFIYIISELYLASIQEIKFNKVGSTMSVKTHIYRLNDQCWCCHFFARNLSFISIAWTTLYLERFFTVNVTVIWWSFIHMWYENRSQIVKIYVILGFEKLPYLVQERNDQPNIRRKFKRILNSIFYCQQFS